jgi:hypothetical protein
MVSATITKLLFSIVEQRPIAVVDLASFAHHTTTSIEHRSRIAHQRQQQ